MRFRQDERGQVLLTSALCMLGLLGFMALAVDVGLLLRARRNLQIAADAGAINGAAELATGYWRPGANAATSLNGISNGTNGAVVTVNDPPSQGSYKESSGYVEVIISQSQPTFFMHAFGRSSMMVNVRAVAHEIPSTNCIYAMQSSPKGGSGIVVTGNSSSKLSVRDCGLIVNATGNSAVSVSGQASITAYSLSVAGSGVTTGGGGSITTTNPATTTTGITPVSDPLAGIISPPADPGGCTSLTVNSSATIGPTSGGSVCYSSLNITGSNTVATLNPGVYYINGNLSIQGGASVSGTGVTFYITNGGSVSVAGNSPLNLSAPTSGALSGILFYQDPNDTKAATFAGGSSGTINGIFYLPNAQLNLTGGSNTTFNVDLVVGLLQVSGGASLEPYAPLGAASPLSTPNLAE